MSNNFLLLRISLAAVWLLTPLATLVYPHAQNMALLEPLGLQGTAASTALSAGIALDIVMGILTLINRRDMQKWLWPSQAIVIIFYSIIIVIFLPEYALHPFGMLIKNLPMLAILWILWQDATQQQRGITCMKPSS